MATNPYDLAAVRNAATKKPSVVSAMKRRIRELEAELAEARLDSARLDWLQEWMKFGRNDLLTRYRVFDGKVYANLIHPDDAMGAKVIPGQDNIRVAIDAAMKEAKNGQG